MRKGKVVLLVLLLALSLTACTKKNEVTQMDESTNIVTDALTQTPTETPVVTATITPTDVAESTDEPIAADKTLKDVFSEHGLKVGTCLSEQMIMDDKCVDFIKANFSSITFENRLKPDYILNKTESQKTGELVVSFDSTTKSLLDWCRDNDMKVRGHVLIWHSQTPDWIFYEGFDKSAGLVSREVMLERMESYIKQTFETLEENGYLDLFYAYDIVNEAWMEDGSKRDSLWFKTIGDDYMWYAFNYANEYAPDYIDIYYNDYNEQFKTETLLNFVQTLVDEDGNYLIDGVGLQGHLYTGDNIEDYLHTVEVLGATGLKINLTELDVSLGTWQNINPATEDNLKEQGRYYYNLVNGIFKLVDEDKVNMDSFTFWGFSDGLSWRRERSPMLLYTSFQKKYAYYGAIQQKDQAGFDE